MLFTPFPLLRGDVYKGLGAFFCCCFVVGIIIFFYPPKKLPLPFSFSAHLKNKTGIKLKKAPPPNSHHQKKKKKEAGGPSFHLPCPAPAKAPFTGADGVGMETVVQHHVGRGRRGGCPKPPLCLAAGCYISQVITSE